MNLVPHTTYRTNLVYIEFGSQTANAKKKFEAQKLIFNLIMKQKK